MAKSSVHVTKTRTVKTTTARVKKGSTGKGIQTDARCVANSWVSSVWIKKQLRQERD